MVATQSFQRSETYATKGAPSAGALKPTGQGFELQPLTHPNEIYVDEGFSFVLLADGRPVPDQEFAIYKSGDVYAEKRFKLTGKSDAQGKAKATFTEPGVYVLEASYPGRGDLAAPPAAKSYRYTLSFEVTR